LNQRVNFLGEIKDYKGVKITYSKISEIDRFYSDENIRVSLDTNTLEVTLT
jgi:hypothetical protein